MARGVCWARQDEGLNPLPAAVPPTIAATLLIGQLFDHSFGDVSAVLDWAALAVLVAGFFVVSRLQLALKASDATAEAWKNERDAAIAHADRLSTELTVAQEKVKILEGRPTLDMLVLAIEKLSTSVDKHDVGARDRTERIIQAIKETSIGN